VTASAYLLPRLELPPEYIRKSGKRIATAETGVAGFTNLRPTFRYNLRMWGRVIIGAVVVVLVGLAIPMNIPSSDQ
jgi:hypothetical protein